MEPHSDVLRCFFSDIQKAIAHPGGAASMLYQEGVVSEDIVGEVVVSDKPCSDKSAAIMRAVSAAVGADPKKLWVLMAVLEKFAESAPVASRMRDALRSQGLEAPQPKATLENLLSPTSSTQGSTSPVENVPMRGASSQEGEVTVLVPEEYKKDFDRIQSRFARLFDNVTKMVEKADKSLEDLKRLFTFNDDLEAPLQDADTITKAMRVVQQHSSFTNCTYLEEMVDHFKIPEATKEIELYEQFVEEFCNNKLRQHTYAAFLLDDPSKHLFSSESITFKLEWSPVKKTLANIKGILKKTFKSLASRIHIVVVGGGSVTVTCYAPQYLMGALVRLAQKNKEKLVKSGVTYLSVGYAVLLDNSAQEEISSLEDQIFTLKKEKEELQLELKKIQELGEQLSTTKKQVKLDLEQTKTALTYQLGKKEEVIQHMKKESQEENISTLTQEKEALELQVKTLQEKLQSQLKKMEQEKADFESQVKSLQEKLQSQLEKMEQENAECEALVISQGQEERLPQVSVNQTTIDMKHSSAEQVEKVFQTLQNNTPLRDLFIDSTSLTADNMATLSFFLNINKTLLWLALGDCALDDHAVEQLSAGLHRNTTLRTLDLSSNPRITDTGASHLAAMLAENNTLKILVLSRCSISDSGVHHLSKRLQLGSHIMELDLSFNKAITNTGALALSDMIRVNKSVKRLFLEGTSVGEEGAAAIMESLRHNDTVTELWLPDELAEYYMRHSVYEEVQNVVRF